MKPGLYDKSREVYKLYGFFDGFNSYKLYEAIKEEYDNIAIVILPTDSTKPHDYVVEVEGNKEFKELIEKLAKEIDELIWEVIRGYKSYDEFKEELTKLAVKHNLVIVDVTEYDIAYIIFPAKKEWWED